MQLRIVLTLLVVLHVALPALPATCPPHLGEARSMADALQHLLRPVRPAGVVVVCSGSLLLSGLVWPQ